MVFPLVGQDHQSWDCRSGSDPAQYRTTRLIYIIKLTRLSAPRPLVPENLIDRWGPMGFLSFKRTLLSPLPSPATFNPLAAPITCTLHSAKAPRNTPFWPKAKD